MGSKSSLIARNITRFVPIEGHWFMGQPGSGTIFVRLALLSSMLQTAIIIGLEVKVYLMHLSDVNILESSPKSTDAIDFQAAKIISVYHLVFITAQVFQLLLCLDAVFRQDTIQIIGLAVFNFLLLLYSVVQHIQTNNAIGSLVDALHLNESTASGLRGSTDFEITVIAILAFFSFTFAFQAWHLFQEFGWKIYKKIGADLNMRRMYRVHQIFVTILKFDIFVFIAFAAQLWSIIASYGDRTGLIIHAIFSLAGSIIMLIIGFWATYQENNIGMFAFTVGILGTMGYLIYRVIKIYPPYVQLNVVCTQTVTPPNCDRFMGSRIFLTLFIIASLIMGVITLGISYKVYKNFGKGLKYRLQSNRKGGSFEMGNDAHRRQQRWSIE